MSEKPLLIVGVSEPAPRQAGSPQFPPQPRFPGRQRQVERIDPKFQRLRDVVEGLRDDVAIQSDQTDLAPDRAIVFEVAGSLSGFAVQAERIGFKFLGELEGEFDPDEDFYFRDRRDQQVTGRLYLVMPDLRAMREMLSLWQRYSRGEEFERGFGQWKKLFAQLHDLRPWGAGDRVTDGFAYSIQEWLQSETSKPFRFEVDLWFSRNDEYRVQAREDVLSILGQVSGQILYESYIPEIRYHGLLAEMPKEVIQQYESPMSLPIAALDSIMSLNPQAMVAYDSQEVIGDVDELDHLDSREEVPVAALLDGFPMANHACLDGKIEVDDFLGIEGECVAERRHHGTGMASLIVNGDLHDNIESQNVISSKLLVLPLLVPDQDDPNGPEIIPSTQLDRAIIHLKQGTGGEPPVGEKVVVINHSIADRNNAYANRISPWARLLDFLSFKYGVLFIVSAGNYSHNVSLSACGTTSEYEGAEQDKKYELYVKAIAEDMRNRQVLSPAEALNPLTVGAWHQDNCDYSGPLPSGLLDILPERKGPSIISAVGLGHKRSIKPDLFYEGGRVLARVMPNGNCCSLWPFTQPSRYAGQKVAAIPREGLNYAIA